MPSLKDLRNRITSVKATQKITKAMQMVAAAKLRRAQIAAEAARPYVAKMESVIGNLALGISDAEAPALLVGNGSEDVHLLVVCTAERGLCGAFNSSIVRMAREHINALLNEKKKVKILCVGKKGYDQLKRQYEEYILDVVDLRALKKIEYGDANKIGHRIVSMFDAGEFDIATIFYSQFKSIMQQIPSNRRIIPAEISGSVRNDCVYEYEPDEVDILAQLLPRGISVQIFRALLENAASEQGSRMSAMDSATRNAGEMIKKQTQKYNRTRQAMITKELIEIISGAEAL